MFFLYGPNHIQLAVSASTARWCRKLGDLHQDSFCSFCFTCDVCLEYKYPGGSQFRSAENELYLRRIPPTPRRAPPTSSVSENETILKENFETSFGTMNWNWNQRSVERIRKEILNLGVSMRFYLVLAIAILVCSQVLACPKYNRKDYRHWIDEDRDCQNTRNEWSSPKKVVHLVVWGINPIRIMKRGLNCLKKDTNPKKLNSICWLGVCDKLTKTILNPRADPC